MSKTIRMIQALCTRFEEKYRQLYPDLPPEESPWYAFGNQPEYSKYHDVIRVLRRIRNTVSYENLRIGNEDIIEISDSTYNLLKEIIEYMTNPSKVAECLVPKKNLEQEKT